MRTDRGVLTMTALLVVAVTLLLQLWRPYFYLTDDSFTGFYPVAREMCTSLWDGESIIQNRHLFGGSFDLRNDTASIGLWSPWLFLFSPLGLTSLHPMLVDAVSLGNSLVIALAFAGSMLFLRRRLGWAASDYVIVLAALSSTFSPFNLLIGSSWVGFLNAQAVYPVALAAAHARRPWLAALPVAGTWVFGALGGHLHPTLLAVGFGGLLMILVAWARRAWGPLVTFGAGGLLAMLVLAPFLAPGFTSFTDVPRAAGMSAKYLTLVSVPVGTLLQSVFLGPVSSGWGVGFGIFESEPAFGSGLGFSLVSLPAIAAVAVAARRRRLDALSWCLLALALAAAVWVVHPLWLAEIHARVPLLKSLRWPFRELAVLLFALHVLFVRHAAGLASIRSPLRLAPAAAGAASLAMLAFGPPPTFNAFALDRELVLSGESERHWARIRRDAGGPVRIIVGARVSLLRAGWKHLPFSALGGYNFASLYEVVNVSGYAVISPRIPGFPGMGPVHWGGIFREEDARYIYERSTGLTLVLAQSLVPLRWTVTLPVPAKTRWFRIEDETGAIVEEEAPVPGSSLPPEPPPRSDFEPLSPPRE